MTYVGPIAGKLIMAHQRATLAQEFLHGPMANSLARAFLAHTAVPAANAAIFPSRANKLIVLPPHARFASNGRVLRRELSSKLDSVPPRRLPASAGRSSASHDNAWRDSQSSTAPFNGMSVDVEDWFQVGAFENTIARSDWDRLECRVERNVDAVLELFDEASVKATFFTLGWIAERYPQVVRSIVDAGHEIASHGWDHRRVFTMQPEQFARDISHTTKLLEDISGQKLIGYRAPSFSIDQRTPWAHEILAEQGYLYSSSVAPIAHDHYGWREAPRFAFRPVSGAPLIEIPVTTVEIAGRRMAAGGGGFFRLLPYALSSWAIRRLNNQDNCGAVFYFHPWEVDPGQPRVADAPVKSRLRHYSNLSRMSGKLSQLLDDFSWGRMDEFARRATDSMA